MPRKKEFLVLGLGRFGTSVAVTLAEHGCEVMAVDEDAENVRNISEHVTNAMQADVSDERVLRSLGLANFDVVIVCIGRNWESCILATLISKEMGANYVIAKAATEMQRRILEKVGADRVIFPEKEMGIRVAHHLLTGTALDFLELPGGRLVAEIPVLKEWANKTVMQSCIRTRFGLNIVNIIRDNRTDVSIDADTVIHEGDKLVVIGRQQDIQKVLERMGLQG